MEAELPVGHLGKYSIDLERIGAIQVLRIQKGDTVVLTPREGSLSIKAQRELKKMLEACYKDCNIVVLPVGATMTVIRPDLTQPANPPQ